jgi:hypothetical protein
MDMDALSSIIGGKTTDVLISALIGRGFTPEQAQNFLPEAGVCVISAFRDNEGTTDLQTIRGKIDLAAIAKRAGVDSNLLNNGMDYIIPSILSQIDDGGLVKMLGKK